MWPLQIRKLAMETDRNSQSLLCFLLDAPIMADRLSERAMHTGWVRFFKGVWNGLFFCYNNRLCHKLAHHCLSICLINYCSINGSRMATCRIMERFGFEPWSGAALRCVLGQVTSISQCLSPPRYYVYKWVPANLMLRVTVWNVKKQFVAQSVIHVCIEKLTTAMENELV